MKVPPYNKSFEAKNPTTSLEWMIKNSITPDKVYASSNQKAWWKCTSCGWEWEAVVASRNKGYGCPKCAEKYRNKEQSTPPHNLSLEYLRPDLLSEWFCKNDRKPSEVYAKGGYKAWWKCAKGHDDYLMSCRDRCNNHGCSKCAKKLQSESKSTPPYTKSLAYLYPSIASELSSDNPRTADKIYAGSSFEYLWICPKGHKWKSTVSSRTGRYHKNCTYCYGKGKGIDSNRSVAQVYPEILKEWSNKNTIDPYKTLPHCKDIITFTCSKCGVEWEARLYNRTSKNPTGCPKCNPSPGTSYIEEKIRNSLLPYGASQDSQTKIGNWKVDIYFPKSKTVVEYDGSRWHSFSFSYERDRRKSLELLSQGYRVIRIRDLSILPPLQIDSPNYYEIDWKYKKEPDEEVLTQIGKLL